MGALEHRHYARGSRGGRAPKEQLQREGAEAAHAAAPRAAGGAVARAEPGQGGDARARLAARARAAAGARDPGAARVLVEAAAPIAAEAARRRRRKLCSHGHVARGRNRLPGQALAVVSRLLGGSARGWVRRYLPLAIAVYTILRASRREPQGP